MWFSLLLRGQQCYFHYQCCWLLQFYCVSHYYVIYHYAIICIRCVWIWLLSPTSRGRATQKGNQPDQTCGTTLVQATNRCYTDRRKGEWGDVIETSVESWADLKKSLVSNCLVFLWTKEFAVKHTGSRRQIEKRCSSHNRYLSCGSHCHRMFWI